MQNDETHPSKQELKRLYNWINNKYKLNLPSIFLTFQSQGRKRHTKGWFWAGGWLKKKKKYCEINICSEFLNDAYVSAEILIHEIAHLYNSINGIIDVSRHQYHNKNFTKSAERLGLEVEARSESLGFGITSLSPKLKEALDLKFKLQKDIFDIKRKQNTKSKFSLIKIADGLYALPKWEVHWRKKIKDENET